MNAAVINAVPGGESLAGHGPIDNENGYPFWYEDFGLASEGIEPVRLELCLETLMCGAEIPDPSQPISFPENYPDEGFWWAGEASIDDRAVGDRALLVYAQEAAFGDAGGVAVDKQIAFTRQRIRIDALRADTEYTITTPYGVEKIVTDVEGEINETQDIGCMTPPCGFDLAMQGHVGPFLRWAPNVGLNPPEGYIGDPGTPHEVVGSPYDTNFFRIEGPDAGGTGVDMVETELFSVSGRIAQLRATVHPAGDLFGGPVDVKVQASFPAEADVIYTLDGSEPTLTNGTRVPSTGTPDSTATVTVPGPEVGAESTVRETQLRYIAVNPDTGDTSEVYTQDYVVDTSLPVVAATPAGPLEVLADGRTILQGPQAITLTTTDPMATEGSEPPTVYYTVDGTRPSFDADGEPQGSTQEYSDPFVVRTSTIVNAVAVSEAGILGPNGLFKYTVHNLREVGPVGPDHPFPDYLTDFNDQKLALCLDDAACGLEAPFDTELAEYPENFPGESFWWSAGAELPVAGGGRARLVLAMEAAFANEVPKDGDQVAFGRTRYSMRGLIPGATYRITQPYGVDIMVADPEDEDGAIGYTADIGCLDMGCSYDRLAESQIGPFLKSDAAPAGYLGDGATESTVTGSPLGTNFFKLEQLTDATGTELSEPVVIGQTDQFVVVGRLYDTPLPARPPATPAAPAIDVTAPAIGEATVQLNAANDGGSPVTGFLVRVTNEFGTQVGDLRTAPATATSLRITGLKADVATGFQVAVQNAKGTSDFSALRILPALPPPFPDIPHKTLFFTEIAWLQHEGISNGYVEDGKFKPLQAVNRDVMAAFLYRLADVQDYKAPVVSPFKDVKPGMPFYTEINWLAEQRITTGWEDGTFRPLQPVNRDMMAAFLYRYNNLDK